ncbi:DUF1059 domain-containing protein [Massilia sp. MB5]|uniref:DUF1059 domain-containing protein n=1 Tax=unclassified Massilia TaxID=2609279 RepID=UPI00067D5AC4|nr:MULTISPECIES: DUF1059 domain-containing protein [unclassified Massilia]AKU24926.1 hypothetical protein ACZ75_15720 [Massilia sp. NR 4-1]UMR32498.1 DUF1059 domain-containing protein [Massilia sp. MB5]
MTRKYIDCRDFPSDAHCTVAISADDEDELLAVAVQHAVSVHQHTDSPELRQQIRTMMKDGMPAEHALPGAAAQSGQDSSRPLPH